MLEYKIEESVAYITIDDGKMNVFSHDMLALAEEAFKKAEEDKDVKVVVITGNDTAFSAGFDLTEIKKGPAEMKTLVTRGMKLGHKMFLFPKPIVVVTKGHTLAMGAILLLAADYCIGVQNEKAKIGLNESAIGITMPQIGVEFGRFRLPKRYFERSFLKADIYNMTEAVEVGYLAEVCTKEDLNKSLSEVVNTYKGLDARAYRQTKMRIRKEVVENVNLDEI